MRGAHFGEVVYHVAKLSLLFTVGCVSRICLAKAFVLPSVRTPAGAVFQAFVVRDARQC